MLATWNCRKDVEIFRPYDISVAEISLALQQVPAAQTESVLHLSNRQADTIFVTPSGVRIFLRHLDQLFTDASGAVVPCSTCSDFRLEVVEIQRKGDLIARSTSTVTPENRVLESGAILHLKASCNGQELKLIQNSELKIQIPASAPFFANQLFSNSSGTSDVFTGWTGANTPVTSAEWQVPGGTSFQVGYQMFVPSMHWICAGRMLEEPNSSYCVELPLGFSDQNTQAFIVMKNKNSVVPLRYQADEYRFCAPFIPQGFPVQLVTVSKLGNQYWLGNKDVETGGTNSATVQPQKMSEQQVIEFIKNL
jgi:hypothetical protein